MKSSPFHRFHPLLILALGLSLLPGASPSAAPRAFAQAPESFTLQIQVPALQVVPAGDGTDRLEIPGYTPAGAPGEPALPARLISVALPPDVDPASVQVQAAALRIEDLPGPYRIAPIPAPAAWIEGQGRISPGAEAAGRRQAGLVATGQFFPASLARLESTGRLRRWQAAGLLATPVQYNPATGALRQARELELRISYYRLSDPQAQLAAAAALADSAPDQRPAETFANFDQARAWYAAPAASALAADPANYVILTTNAIASASAKLDDFKAHKQTLGLSVEIVTETAWSGLNGPFPNGRAEKIRKWLQENYLAKGIQYVLLIGSPDPDEMGQVDPVGDLPMKQTWPRFPAPSERDTATDYYYADLTGDWDLDGDGYYGEYADDRGTGGVDFLPEVYVGRIPVYSGQTGWAGRLDSILQKMIAYDNDPSPEWRRRALLPMSFSDQDTDGAFLSERMQADYLDAAGFESVTLYQHKTAGCSSAYSSNADLVDGATLNRWRSQDFGLVSWWAHGSQTGAFIGHTDGAACQDGSLLTTSDTASLDDTRPAFVFQISCTNGYPERDDNLGYALLKNGAIATVSAARVSWYRVGNWEPNASLGDNASLGYLFNQGIASGRLAGPALYDVKGVVGTGWGAETWMNLMDFNLYGDPTSSLLGLTPPEAPSNLVVVETTQNTVTLEWESNSFTEDGFKIERSPDGLAWEEIDTVSGDTFYDDLRLSCAATYHYRVRAFNTAGVSTPSNTAVAGTAACAPRACHSVATLTCGPAVTGRSDGPGSADAIDTYSCYSQPEGGPEVAYAFVAPTAGMVTARLDISPAGTDADADLDLFVLDGGFGACDAGNCTSAAADLGDETLTFSVLAGQVYYLVVDSFGLPDGPYAAADFSLDLECNLVSAPPGSLAAEAVSPTGIRLTWQDNSPDEEGFGVERMDGILRSSSGKLGATGEWQEVQRLGPDVTTFTDAGLLSATAYSYRVFALKGGEKSYSNTASAVTLPPIPTPPQDLTATVGFQQVSLTWIDASSNENGFYVERSEDGGGSWSLLGSLNPGATTYVDTTLACSVNYLYRVRAYNNGGAASSNLVPAVWPCWPGYPVFLPTLNAP